MGVPRGTTPTFTLTFTDSALDLTSAENVYVTFSQGSLKMTKTGDALEVGRRTIAVYLSQSETLRFQIGKAEVQANWTFDGGNRAASEISNFTVTENLLGKEVS